MKTLEITSVESLDATVAELCRVKILLVAELADLEERKAAIDKNFAPRVGALAESISAVERDIFEYCAAHRAELFAERKSRETNAAVIGFEFTPYRVEKASRKLKWEDIVRNLLRKAWGKAYVRLPSPQPDKEALLADREKLTDTQKLAAGITFARDEQFFIRPKSEVAEASTKKG